MRKTDVLISVFLLLCFTFAAVADVVVLKDGAIHKGDIIYKDGKVVIIKTEAGEVLKFSQEDVIWITQEEEPSKPTLREPAGLSLAEATARLTDDVCAQLKASGHAVVAVAPFWGPGDAAVALDDTLAEKITEGLGDAGHRVIEPATVLRVLNALRLQRSSLTDGSLAGRLANILGAGSVVVGRITSVTASVVTFRLAVVEAGTGNVLAESSVLITKSAEVRKLLGEEKPKPEPRPAETSAQLQSAISSKFAPAFALRKFYHKYAAGKPDAKLEGDRTAWTLESGNNAIVTRAGKVIVASTKKLTDEGQALALERDLSGIFVNLSTMAEGYKSGEINKDVEFDSIYYAHKPGVFHRFIFREREDLTRRNWTLRKNGNTIRYAKMGLVIDGSWAKLSVGRSYVVSFGRWTTRCGTSAVQNDEEAVSVKITPYGWIQWYVGEIDIVTEPALTPPEITGWGSTVVEYRTNELIEHLELAPETEETAIRRKRWATPWEKPPRVHTFNYP